ncbi:MAG: hypothetical protein GY928_01480, partial [Colwellia sp.]|nr:hypothetical protein [Colwellia sp.]
MTILVDKAITIKELNQRASSRRIDLKIITVGGRAYIKGMFAAVPKMNTEDKPTEVTDKEWQSKANTYTQDEKTLPPILLNNPKLKSLPLFKRINKAKHNKPQTTQSTEEIRTEISFNRQASFCRYPWFISDDGQYYDTIYDTCDLSALATKLEMYIEVQQMCKTYTEETAEINPATIDLHCALDTWKYHDMSKIGVAMAETNDALPDGHDFKRLQIDECEFEQILINSKESLRITAGPETHSYDIILNGDWDEHRPVFKRQHKIEIKRNPIRINYGEFTLCIINADSGWKQYKNVECLLKIELRDVYRKQMILVLIQQILKANYKTKRISLEKYLIMILDPENVTGTSEFGIDIESKSADNDVKMSDKIEIDSEEQTISKGTTIIRYQIKQAIYSVDIKDEDLQKCSRVLVREYIHKQLLSFQTNRDLSLKEPPFLKRGLKALDQALALLIPSDLVKRVLPTQQCIDTEGNTFEVTPVMTQYAKKAVLIGDESKGIPAPIISMNADKRILCDYKQTMADSFLREQTRRANGRRLIAPKEAVNDINH